MFVAGQQAAGLEAMLAQQKDHAKELGQAHTEGTKQAAGLLTEQLAITAGSPFVGRRLGDTRARTRTSASPMPSVLSSR